MMDPYERIADRYVRANKELDGLPVRREAARQGYAPPGLGIPQFMPGVEPKRRLTPEMGFGGLSGRFLRAGRPIRQLLPPE